VFILGHFRLVLVEKQAFEVSWVTVRCYSSWY